MILFFHMSVNDDLPRKASRHTGIINDIQYDVALLRIKANALLEKNQYEDFTNTRTFV